jgi:hypothetical protein
MRNVKENIIVDKSFRFALCKNSHSYPFEEKMLDGVRELIKILSKIISTSKS